MGKEAAKKFVTEMISKHQVLVFSKSYCPYCSKAKHALATLLQPDQITAVELESRPDCDDIQDALQEVTGGRSVPRVFIAGEFIGGGDDTARKAGNGELKQLLTSKGLLKA